MTYETTESLRRTPPTLRVLDRAGPIQVATRTSASALYVGTPWSQRHATPSVRNVDVDSVPCALSKHRRPDRDRRSGDAGCTVALHYAGVGRDALTQEPTTPDRSVSKT